MTACQVLVGGPGWDGQTDPAADSQFWHFGTDYSRFIRLTEKSVWAVSAAKSQKSVNSVADRIRGEIIDLDERLATGRFSLAWNASDLAERNPLTSDFYLNLSRSIALIEAARAGGQHRVVVDDARLGLAVVNLCRRAGISADYQGEAPGWFAGVIGGLRAHASFIRVWIMQRRALRRFPVSAARFRGRDVIIATWLDGSDLGDTEGLLGPDRHLGDVPIWIRECGLSCGWLCIPTYWAVATERLAQLAARLSEREPLVITSAFFRFGSVLRAYARFLEFPFATRWTMTLQEVDVTPILRLALRHELMSPRLVMAAQYVDVARMLKQLQAAPRIVFYTYENQPFEKMLIAGFRKFLPSTRLVGVQHSTFARNYLSAFPSARQWRERVAPDFLLTVGDEFHDELVNLGAPADSLRVIGAFRYEAVLRAAPTSNLSVERRPKLVLAACPIDMRESFELADKATAATAGMIGIRLIVNFHPDLAAADRIKISTEVGRRHDVSHVQFVEGRAMDWLSRVDALLYNSSATSFEAVQLGVPLIFVGSASTLDLDKMSARGVLLARDVVDLRSKIEQSLEPSDSRCTRLHAAREHVRRCLKLPDRAAWRDLVGEIMARK